MKKMKNAKFEKGHGDLTGGFSSSVSLSSPIRCASSAIRRQELLSEAVVLAFVADTFLLGTAEAVARCWGALIHNAQILGLACKENMLGPMMLGSKERAKREAKE